MENFNIYAFLKYVLLIPIPFLLLFILNKFNIDKNIIIKKEKIVILFLFIFYVLIISSLKLLKLYYFNYPLFDSGLYINKLYLIANENLIINKLHIAMVEGHFQPILLFYAVIFELLPNPEFYLFAIETVTLGIGVIPIYLLSKHYFNDSRFSLYICLIYFLYPLVSFNDMLGFHPDHIVLPALLFSFYFSVVKKYLLTVISLLIIAVSSEPWVFLITFFGLYLVFSCRKFILGSLISSFSLIYFLIIYFYILRISGSDSGYILSTESSPYLNLIKLDFIQIIRDFNIRKLFFVFFIFFPLLFIPVLSPIFLFVSIPEFAKTLISNEPLHYAVEGHYTLGIIGCVFPSFIKGLHYIKVKYGINNSLRCLYISVVMTFIFSIIHSPFPWSKDFLTLSSNGDFNYRNYLYSKRVESINEMTKYFSKINGKLIIQTSNSAFFSGIANNILYIFPTGNWKESDYIIIEKNSRNISGSISSTSQFSANLIQAVNDLPNYFNLLKSDSYFEVWINKASPKFQ